MITGFKFTILLVVALLVSFNSFAVANAKDNKNLAPKATAAEVEALLAATTDAEDLDLFRDISILKEAFITAAPTNKKDGVLVGKLGADGGNRAMLLKLAEEIADNKHGKYDSLLISHKGKLLFESYYKRGRINLPHGQASATKTYTGLVLGRAIQLGYLNMSDLNKPLLSFLKDLEPEKFIEGAKKITLHQALSMTTGIRVNDENKERMKNNPEKLKGQGEVQALFELSAPITEESQKFAYSAGPQLVMQVIDAVVPGTARDFIKNEFLGKLGIKDYNWLTAQSGLPESGWRASITSRDMVKIGILAMNKGRWQGEQLIPEAFITRSLSRINYSADDVKVFGGGKDTLEQGYGYFWWSADLKSGDKSYFSVSAQGGGGQFIILVEELDLMIVATGHEREVKTLQMTAERILPAFVQDKLPVLESPYFGQKPPGLTPELFAPGVISLNGRFESAVSFSPDLDEIYFAAYYEGEEVAIYFSKLEGNEWSPIKRANFTNGGKKEEMHPFVSPDGRRIYFTALDSRFADEKIWYVDRLADSWSDAVKLDSPINDDLVFAPNQSENGDLFYTNISERRNNYAPNIDGKYPNVQDVKIEFGHHAFISPSQDYLLVTDQNQEDERRKDKYIYVYFKKPDGTWTQAINLGGVINSGGNEVSPRITPDGKYLFFVRGEPDVEIGNVYWVSTDVIRNVRPVDYQD